VLPTVRRTLASLAAWTLGAGVAVGVGVLALSLIDSGLASGAAQTQPLPPDAPVSSSAASPAPSPSEPSPSEPSVSRSPAGPAAPARSPSPAAPSAGSATAGPPHQLASSGGTVIARCTGTTAYLVSWSPAQGYQVDDVRRGPAQTVYATFVNVNRQQVVLAVRCVAGIPERTHYDE
jgi:hypothetical protein